MKRVEDFYGKLAKTKGYLARSVYKLMEIQEKYKMLKKGDRILDLGAAPGSWSQYALEILNGTGFVVSVDLKPIELTTKTYQNFHLIQGSFKNADVLQQIKELGPYHVILSDAAPSTSGDGFIDSHKSIEICEAVIQISRENIKSKGNLILKIFQGGEEKMILDTIKSLFERAKAFKPKASRSESVEVFHLGFNYIKKNS